MLLRSTNWYNFVELLLCYCGCFLWGHWLDLRFLGKMLTDFQGIDYLVSHDFTWLWSLLQSFGESSRGTEIFSHLVSSNRSSILTLLFISFSLRTWPGNLVTWLLPFQKLVWTSFCFPFLTLWTMRYTAQREDFSVNFP